MCPLPPLPWYSRYDCSQEWLVRGAKRNVYSTGPCREGNAMQVLSILILFPPLGVVLFISAATLSQMERSSSPTNRSILLSHQSTTRHIDYSSPSSPIHAITLSAAIGFGRPCVRSCVCGAAWTTLSLLANVHVTSRFSINSH